MRGVSPLAPNFCEVEIKNIPDIRKWFFPFQQNLQPTWIQNPSGASILTYRLGTDQVRSTQPLQTLFLFKSIWKRPQGSQGCQKVRFFLQIKLLSSCTKIDPERQKLRKSVKIEKKMSKNPVFLYLFKCFAILAQQTSNEVFSGCRRFFWHP